MTTSPPSPRVRRAGAFALAAVAALSTWGSAASRAGDPPPDESTVTITITDQQPVEDLLKSLMRATMKPILWSADDKAITMKKMGPAQTLRAPRGKLFDTVRAMLVPMEIVLVPLGPAGWEFFQAIDARALQAQFLLKAKPVYMELTDANLADFESQDGLFVSAMIRAPHVTDLRDARAALQRLITQNNIGSVQEVPSAHAFVVTDFAPNVASIYRLVKQMDASPPAADAPQPTFLRLQHANAGKVRSILLEQMGISLVYGPTPSGTSAGAGPGGTPVYGPVDPRISADDASNQLVVTAREADLAKIRRIVEGLDVEKAK